MRLPICCSLSVFVGGKGHQCQMLRTIFTILILFAFKSRGGKKVIQKTESLAKHLIFLRGQWVSRNIEVNCQNDFMYT